MNASNNTQAPAIFLFQDTHILRVVTIGGEPWFVAADVCAALELGSVTKALIRLDDDENTLISIQGIQKTVGNPNVNIINESGLYSLILGSRKPEAKPFKKWVTSEVLPSIRKHGAYIAPNAKNADIFGHLDPAKTPFERVNANALREYNKMKPELAFAYLVSMGITPEFVDNTLSQAGVALPKLAQSSGAQINPGLSDLIPDFVEEWRNGELAVPFGPVHVNQVERLFSHWCGERGHIQNWSRHGVGSTIARSSGLYKTRGRYRWGKKLTQGAIVMPQYDRPPVEMSLEDYLSQSIHRAEEALRRIGA